MPVFDYRCSECGSNYDIYHKAKEIAEDILCPQCGSTKYKKLMSVSSISMGGGISSSRSPEPSCDAGGGCCGGACGLN